jgi:hypothetical protein
MNKGTIVASIAAVMLLTANGFSSPINKFRGFPHRLLPIPGMLAKAPASASGTITHLVLDSTIYESHGYVESLRAIYNLSGQLDSVLAISGDNYDYGERFLFFYNANGLLDSMLDQVNEYGNWENQSKDIYTIPLSGSFFPNLFDQFFEGQGWGEYTDFSDNLSKTSGCRMYWDSTSHSWTYFSKDTLMSLNNETKVYLLQKWDTTSGSWKIYETDTIVISDGRVVQAIENRCDNLVSCLKRKHSLIYDDHGRVIEYRVETWNTADQTWGLSYTYRYSLEYNSHNHLTSWRSQKWNNSSSTWASIDSGEREFYSYTYNAKGNITSRIDTTFSAMDFEPFVITHYFQYQTFPTPTIPRLVSKAPPQSPVTVSSDGKIKLLNSTDNLSATLYTLSGRSVCRIPLHADVRLSDYCSQTGIHPGKGLFLLRVTCDQTRKSLGEWKVFLQ